MRTLTGGIRTVEVMRQALSTVELIRTPIDLIMQQEEEEEEKKKNKKEEEESNKRAAAKHDDEDDDEDEEEVYELDADGNMVPVTKASVGPKAASSTASCR